MHMFHFLLLHCQSLGFGSGSSYIYKKSHKLNLVIREEKNTKKILVMLDFYLIMLAPAESN